MSAPQTTLALPTMEILAVVALENPVAATDGVSAADDVGVVFEFELPPVLYVFISQF